VVLIWKKKKPVDQCQDHRAAAIPVASFPRFLQRPRSRARQPQKEVQFRAVGIFGAAIPGTVLFCRLGNAYDQFAGGVPGRESIRLHGLVEDQELRPGRGRKVTTNSCVDGTVATSGPGVGGFRRTPGRGSKTHSTAR